MTSIDRHRPRIAALRAPLRGRSRGAVLVVALILLLVLTLIGITAARLQTAQEGMARNDDNHELALQFAEAALRDGQAIINLHGPGDFLTDNNGLYNLSQELQNTSSSIADTINWTSPGSATMQYSGAALANAPPSPQPAQILIESMPPVAVPGSPLNGSGYGANPQWQVYRVTAHAWGGDSSSNVTLQTIISSMPVQ